MRGFQDYHIYVYRYLLVEYLHERTPHKPDRNDSTAIKSTMCIRKNSLKIVLPYDIEAKLNERHTTGAYRLRVFEETKVFILNYSLECSSFYFDLHARRGLRLYSQWSH